MSIVDNDPIIWSYGSDNFLTLGHDDLTDEGEALFNVLDETYPEDATVTATIKNKAGTNVTGAVGISMPHVVGTTGEDTLYRALFDDTLTMPVGQYEATVTAVKAGVKKLFHKTIYVRRG
jgi:hypothetical protein